ncbi:hypothetical protein A2U01_0079106, partial [Trifolium medium]|nr:hypothetical protein [Trifolium medium]
MVRPEFEAEPGPGSLMSPGDANSRQARCCLLISPDFASRRETFWTFFA